MNVNGVDIRLGDLIPPYRITIVELPWANDDTEEEYTLRRHVELDRATKARKQELSPLHVEKTTAPVTIGARNFAVHRKLCLQVLNPNLPRMIALIGQKNMVDDVEKWREYDYDLGMSFHYYATNRHKNMSLPLPLDFA